MSLSARTSVFFLAALGLVLAGFSVTLYVAARVHLVHLVDERLDAALNVLDSLTEAKPDDPKSDLQTRKRRERDQGGPVESGQKRGNKGGNPG